MAKKTTSIEEKINKLTAIKETIEYLEQRIDYSQSEIDDYIQQATDSETGEVNTTDWSYRRAEEYKAMKAAYEELILDLERLA